jgi:glycerol-3-phosphate dehydrogenase
MAFGRDSDQVEVQSKAVVNATGAWSEHLSGNTKTRGQKIVKNLPDIRRLRGSHLIFPAEKLPVNRAISIWHPKDKRPVFTFPWEGVTVVGTTDVDFNKQMVTDPCISNKEVEYLIDAVRFTFPSLDLDAEDIQSTFSGIRSVVDTGKKEPSKESREHFLRFENGLLTIGGGKLTTFRLMAKQAMILLIKKIPDLMDRNSPPPTSISINPELQSEIPIDQKSKLRLLGRYGIDVPEIIEISDPSELSFIGSTPNLWVEIRWAARAEGVVHLEDLLLRRVRLGNVLPSGGMEVIERIKQIVIKELDWGEELWEKELRNYKLLLEESYSIES